MNVIAEENAGRTALLWSVHGKHQADGYTIPGKTEGSYRNSTTVQFLVIPLRSRKDSSAHEIRFHSHRFYGTTWFCQPIATSMNSL